MDGPEPSGRSCSSRRRSPRHNPYIPTFFPCLPPGLVFQVYRLFLHVLGARGSPARDLPTRSRSRTPLSMTRSVDGRPQSLSITPSWFAWRAPFDPPRVGAMTPRRSRYPLTWERSELAGGKEAVRESRRPVAPAKITTEKRPRRSSPRGALLFTTSRLVLQVQHPNRRSAASSASSSRSTRAWSS